MAGTHNFRKLLVWQRSLEFVALVYRVTLSFPKEEKYGLIDQIRRAAISVTLNIAEGAGSGSNAEFKRFLKMAQRSAYEVIAGLEVAIKLNMTDKETLEGLVKEVDQLSAMISGLIKSLKSDN